MRSRLLKFTNYHILALLELIALIKAGILVFLIKDRGWEPDSYMHFIELRTVYSNIPDNLDIGISVWAKPLYTYLLGLPVALFSFDTLIPVQLMNILIFSITFYLVYLIANVIFENNRYALLSLGLSLFSYNLFKSSITALTEPIFTLCIVFGFYLVLKKKYILAGLLFGISILGRIEGLYFLGTYNLWLVYKFELVQLLLKRFKSRKLEEIIEIKSKVISLLKVWVISVIPVLVWNILGFIHTGRLIYIFDKGYPTEAGQYGFGTILHFPRKLLIEETVIFFLFILGSLVLFYSYIYSYRKISIESRVSSLYTYRSELILAWILAAGFTATQMYFWVIGQFGSAGLSRYLVSVLPFYIFICTLGVKAMVNRLKLNTNINYEYFIISGIILAHLFMLIANFSGIKPLSRKWIVVDQDVIDAGKYIGKNYSDTGIEVNSTRPEVIYYAKRDTDWNEEAQNFSSELRNREPGIYVWDEEWKEAFKLSKADLDANAELVKQFDSMYIYEIR